MCAPDSALYLPYFSHWWFFFLSSCALHNSWMIPLVQKTLIKKKIQIYGKETWKTSNRHIFIASLWIREKEQGPEGSALDLLQLESFSHSLPCKLPTWANILIFQSRSLLHRPLFIHLFHSLVSLFLIAPLSHTHIPLQIIFLLEPVLMASFQEQQVWISSSLKWRQEVGGVRPGGDIGSLVSIVLSVQPSPRPPGTLLSLPLPFFPDIPHITHKRRRNRYAQEKASWSLAGKTRDPPSPPLVRQLVSIRCSKPYKYSLFSLISYYFSFLFLTFPSLPLDSLLGGGWN